MNTNSSPKIYRLLAIYRTPHLEGGQRVTAKLYFQNATQNVEWWCQQTDAELTVDSLVTVEGKLFEISPGRVMILGQLITASTPNPDVNLFDTIPMNWQVDDMVRDQAAKLWNTLPPSHRRIFNQIFWDKARFHRYVTDRRCGDLEVPISHLAWVVRATTDQFNRAVSNREAGLADLLLTGLLLDAGSLDGPSPQSYVQLLEWLLQAHRDYPQLEDDLMPRLAWNIVQVHGLIDQPRTVLESHLLADITEFADLQ